MRFTFAEKKIETSEALRQYAERKIGKLDKFFRTESDASVTFSIERGRQIAEVTLRNNGMFYRVTEATGDMYASIDSAVASIERQIRKNKTRLEKRLREGSLSQPEETSVRVEEEEPEEEFKIVRTKRFSIKPMTPEEAILQMNLLDHEWFVFRDQNNDGRFAVVYKRKHGDYGLIEDE
ncbi:MAG: ribosome hibernation-promoting factor, HPF/YfiA family [bacterium]